MDDYFVFEGEVYCGEVAYNTYPLKDVDVETFEVLSNTEYARDKNKVYFPFQSICVDGENWGNCHAVEYIMEGADPESFEHVDWDYTKDKNHVYWKGKIVEGADPVTFHIEITELGPSAKDSANSYIDGWKM